MKKSITKSICAIIVLFYTGLFSACSSPELGDCGNGCEKAKPASNSGAEYDVAAYVWPAFQPAPEWQKYKLFPKGIGEWEFVKEAESKKTGHKQPIKPLWGYEPEDNPIVLARKIDACLAAGVNVLIYDWYWYNHAPFLENGLNAFLKAPNSERMKFAIMWANHEIDDLWDKTVPVKCTDKNGYRHIRAEARVSEEEFKNVLVPRWIEYFKKPNYYKINGKPLFQVFSPTLLGQWFGGAEGVVKMFGYLEEKAREAGFAGVEIQCRSGILKNPKSAKDLFVAGCRGIFVYNWLEQEEISSSYWIDYNGKSDVDYKDWGEKAMGNLEKLAKKYDQFYVCPNVTCGWDTNPRFPKDVYVPVAINNTPERFETFLRRAKAWCDANTPADKPKLILINALNEWTEGCHLEPDEENGYGFLNAVSRVFGAHGQAKQ